MNSPSHIVIREYKKTACCKLTLALCILLTNSIIAQDAEKNISHSNQHWIQYYNRLKLAERVTLLSDGSVRWKYSFSNLSQLLVRTGCSYSFHKGKSVSAGIASTLSYNKNRPSRGEFRIWQEISSQGEVKRFNISARLRLEEQFFKKIIENKFCDNSFNYRIRFRLYATIPLNHDIITAKTISINAGNEIFINFGKEIVYNMFDNNRILGGISYQINKSWSLNLNYVYQYTQKNLPNVFEQSNILWLSFTNIALRSKAKK